MNAETLTRYLIAQRRRFPDATGDFNALVLDVAIACKAIARSLALGRLPGPAQAPARVQGKYLLLFEPLADAENIDVNLPVGSLFSVLRAPEGAFDESHLLQPGHAQLAAGYALYGPTTLLVLTVGNGVAGFTLDRDMGEFMLTHPDLRVPADTREFAINASNRRFWERPVQRYVDECQRGREGPRGKDFGMRWIASLVAEVHRILVRGGVFLDPRDSREPQRAARLRLLDEANPIALLIEQAGGRASTGRRAVLGLQPEAPQQRTGLVFGSRNEVERIERYHAEPGASDSVLPLFAERTLFRAA